MLLAEDPLDLLIDRLRGLPPADRRGVLARLSLLERRRVEAGLRQPSVALHARLAPDIAARIAAPSTNSAMTGATRDVLLRIAGLTAPVARPTAAGPSLFGRVVDALRRR